MEEDTRHPQPTPAESVRQGVAAMAEHLMRSGVHCLPVANPENVQNLHGQIPVSNTETVPESNVADRVAEPANPSASQSAEEQNSVSNVHATSESVAQQRNQKEIFQLTDAPKSEAGAYPGAGLGEEERVDRLGQQAELVKQCRRCEILSKCRTNTVYGEGSAEPRFVFFGEGPGRDEDLSGRPFVGKAGQLLTKMIAACQLKREDVYIMNTVKCRPPNNRNPEPSEIENCREYFESQLETLRPDYIVCLGLVAAQSLLQNKLSVGRMRGKLHRYYGSKVLVTYHPSYLLRTPAAKKAAWDDLQLMLRDAGMM